MQQGRVTKDTVAHDAMRILRNVKDHTKAGRAIKLAEVKEALGDEVAFEFDSYFFFLRKFHYLAMDREAHLKLTDQGERALIGEFHEQLSDDAYEFFSEQLSGTGEHKVFEETIMAPPPPTTSDLNLDETPRPHTLRPQRKDEMPPPPTVAPVVTAPDTIRSSGSGVQPAATVVGPNPNPIPLPLTAAISSSPSSIMPKGNDLDLRYHKGELVGQGPLGSVFKGKHNALGVDVAVKELKDIFGYFSFLQRGEVIKRLKKELCMQAQVRHVGIVQILDQNTDVARPYFVTELCKGSLREKLDASKGAGLPVKIALRYFLQLAYALRAAHQQGLTHHNIKPENVLFDAYGNAKLSDFGLSRVIEVDQSKGMPQVFVGTGGMGYMSPELIGRSKEAGTSSDVYGLGILLYEMLTGQLPGRRSPMPSEINKEIPAKIDSIFDKMTQDRRDARFNDFEATLDAFYAQFAEKEFLSKGEIIIGSELVSA